MNTTQHAIIEHVLVQGDLARLTPEQRTIYYTRVCESLGLNPLSRPFEYITLNGRLVLYARKDCTDQLRKLHNVSIRIAGREVVDDLMVVTAEATDRTGRTDCSIGAVCIGNLRGEAKANALMKAETKARRRVTLAICGLGMLDETEVETIPNARIEPQERAADRLLAAPSAPEVPATAPQQESDAQPGDESTCVIDIASIEEHRNKSGASVYKITAADGAVFAAADAMVVDDISSAHRADRPVRIHWQKRGQRRLILEAQEVAE